MSTKSRSRLMNGFFVILFLSSLSMEGSTIRTPTLGTVLNSIDNSSSAYHLIIAQPPFYCWLDGYSCHPQRTYLIVPL